MIENYISLIKDNSVMELNTLLLKINHFKHQLALVYAKPIEHLYIISSEVMPTAELYGAQSRISYLT
ncbi:hypothetical protein [Acinetobacter bouvetii]|uniref:Uncharacterized protein n=1 Tax=Acinetobacter bouvetii TaxID=202951 RepID=A0A811GG85_9GAMM|nr:hypothetical protein [Acinetobacter bouvetii]CAB1221613.1 hypothetical protein SFB21_2894 [Acinetobacter bouvetii]